MTYAQHVDDTGNEPAVDDGLDVGRGARCDVAQRPARVLAELATSAPPTQRMPPTTINDFRYTRYTTLAALCPRGGCSGGAEAYPLPRVGQQRTQRWEDIAVQEYLRLCVGTRDHAADTVQGRGDNLPRQWCAEGCAAYQPASDTSSIPAVPARDSAGDRVKRSCTHVGRRAQQQLHDTRHAASVDDSLTHIQRASEQELVCVR